MTSPGDGSGRRAKPRSGSSASSSYGVARCGVGLDLEPGLLVQVGERRRPQVGERASAGERREHPARSHAAAVSRSTWPRLIQATRERWSSARQRSSHSRRNAQKPQCSHG